MESYRHSGTAGSGDSSSRRYQQLPTRSDPVQQPAVAGSSGVRLATGTRDPAMLLVGPRGSSSSSSATTTDYSDSCSSSDCSSTSSWSSESIPEWESHIDAEGELFYIEFSSNLQVPTPTTDTASRQPSAEDRQEVLKKKKKKKSRLSRLLKRRAVSNGNNKGGSSAGGNEMASCESPGVYLPTEAQRSPADDWSDWTSFTLELEVHPTTGADGSSLSSGSTGRRNKGPNHLCETLLGFVPGVTQSVDWHGEVSLRQRVIVDKLTPGGPLHQGFAHVQQGDWLEKLNGQNVTHRDLNDILSSINSREIVELNFRRRPTSNDNRNQEPSGGNGGETPAPPHGIFLLSQDNVTEASAETADILYQSSSNTNTNRGGGGTDTSNGIDPLLKWRGAIVTLAHLMPQLTGSAPPSCSTVILDGMIVHLVYIVEGSVLFLIGAPSIWCSRIELQMTAKQLASLFRFQYGSIRRALTEPRLAGEIRRMVDSLFHWLQQGAGTRSGGNASTVSPGGSNDMSRPFNRLSNYFVTCGQWLPLPPESHLDVTLTLNQMEAIDYEDWDEESISIQRCATITGSAVYCQGYLVASTMAAKRLEEIGTFLKWNQILEMSHRRRLSSLIIWRQVFPESEDAGNRSFLVVVGSGHILVVALLESGGVTQSWDHYPDTFLIEEMQFFLQELQYLDLETTCNQILNGPQNPALVTNLSQVSECTTPISSSPESEMPTFRYFRCFISSRSATPSWKLSSITPGLRPTMINYLLMDFGTGVFVAPTILNAGTRFIDQFQKTCLTIHNLFQRTLKAKMELQRPDWGGPWSDKSLVALQEVSVVFTITESPPSPGSGTKSTPMSDSFWVTGRLFLSPVHRELYVCHQDGVAQDILDLAFHLAFGAVL